MYSSYWHALSSTKTKEDTLFFFSWSITLETVEILKTHYENWAKAGSGAGYTNSLDKVIYTNNYNWFSNWIDKYFFNKVLDFILSLIFMAIISLIVFKNKKIISKNARSYKLIFYILLIIGFIWFTIHPSLRYGGFHLFFLLTFIPLSLYLENYSLEIKNFEFKIKTMLTITLLVFFTRNIDRLITENEIYSYSLIKNLNYSIDNEEAFKIQKRFKKLKENKKLCDQKSQKCNNELYKLKKIYNNRYIISRN